MLWIMVWSHLLFDKYSKEPFQLESTQRGISRDCEILQSVKIGHVISKSKQRRFSHESEIFPNLFKLVM